MEPATQVIVDLLGDLSDAHCARITQPGISILDAIKSERYGPESEREKAIWNELTAPHNYDLLLRYVERRRKSDITDYSAALYDTLLEEAAKRLH